MKGVHKDDGRVFVEELKAWLEANTRSLGREGQFGPLSFRSETPYGELSISLYERQNTCYTLYTCFEEPARAARRLDANPHSGKWNFHIDATEDPKGAAARIISSLEPLIASKRDEMDRSDGTDDGDPADYEAQSFMRGRRL